MLEELQESERRGVEGDIAFRGWSESMEGALQKQMIGEALDEIPADDLRTGFLSSNQEHIAAIVDTALSAPLDDAHRIVETASEQSAMRQQPEQWSRYEHPGASNILLDIATRIEHVIGRFASSGENQSIPIQLLAGDLSWTLTDHHRPAIGTLSTGQFTATTQTTADDSVVILVENGLFPLARSLAQVGLIGYQEVIETGQLSEPTVQAISDAAATYVAMGHTADLPVRDTPPALHPYVAAVEDAILVFVLAHEYAHILNGDLSTHPLGQSADRQPGDEGKEILADSTGLRITLAACQAPGMGGAGLWGSLLFLAGMDVLLRADSAARQEAPVVENDPAGPTPFERARSIAAAVERSDLNDVFGDALGAGLNAFQVVLFAWDIVMPSVWEMGDEVDRGAQGERLPEMEHLFALRRLWQDVRPRVATQRRLN